MKNDPLPRLDEPSEIRDKLIPHCRLALGEMWTDPTGKHRVVCGDATNNGHLSTLIGKDIATLAIHDPPYNLVAFEKRSVDSFTEWCRKWIDLSYAAMKQDSALYVWLGADQNEHFQPLPQFMMMMQGKDAVVQVVEFSPLDLLNVAVVMPVPRHDQPDTDHAEMKCPAMTQLAQ